MAYGSRMPALPSRVRRTAAVRRLVTVAAPLAVVTLTLTLVATLGPGVPPRAADPGPEGVRLAPSAPYALVGQSGPRRRQRDVRTVVATFNVLGASHTRGGDRWPRDRRRMRTTVRLLERHDVTVAALQELQKKQFGMFQRQTGRRWSTWPRLSRGPRVVENSVVWRRGSWAFAKADTIEIPYLRGRTRPMPYVQLRHRDTGRRIWVTSFHNPVSNHRWGNHGKARKRAIGKEWRLARRLHRRSNDPVLVLGDFNGRRGVYCQMTNRGPLQAANGGRHRARCHPPRNPLPVDWLFGTHDIDFGDYRRGDSRTVRRISNHFLVRADLVLDDRDGLR